MSSISVPAWLTWVVLYQFLILNRTEIIARTLVQLSLAERAAEPAAEE